MNNIEELVTKNHEYWMSNKTTYLGSPRFTEKARNGLLQVVERYMKNKPDLAAIDKGLH